MTSLMATIIGALPGTTQITSVMSSIQSFLTSFVLILGPVVFLFGLVAHGLGSTHNSQGMAQWGTRAMKAGAGIVIGAVLLSLLFSVLKGL
jgi:hypothetical protein